MKFLSAAIIMASAVILLAGSAPPTFADTASVTNNVSASANSGGNVVGSGGSTTNGTSTASVQIDQTLDGIAQPPVNITTSSHGPVNVDANVDTSASNGTVTTSRNIYIDPPSYSTSMTSAPATATTTSSPISTSTPGSQATTATVGTSTVTGTAAMAVNAMASTTYTVIQTVGTFFNNVFHWITLHIA